MGIFKSKETKEMEKRLAIKKTIQEMNKQIAKLTESENYFLNIAKKAKEENLDSQLTLAVNALKSTIAQKKKVQEMLLNFQIMTQTKDMLITTAEFLKGMGSLSSDMSKLCNDKEFEKVSVSFEKAMQATEMQTERIDNFLDNSKDRFQDLSEIENGGAVKDQDIYAMIDNEAVASASDEEFDELTKKVKEKINS